MGSGIPQGNRTVYYIRKNKHEVAQRSDAGSASIKKGFVHFQRMSNLMVL